MDFPIALCCCSMCTLVSECLHVSIHRQSTYKRIQMFTYCAQLIINTNTKATWIMFMQYLFSHQHFNKIWQVRPALCSQVIFEKQYSIQILNNSISHSTLLTGVSYYTYREPCPSDATEEDILFRHPKSTGLRWSPEIIISVAFCALSKARWGVHLPWKFISLFSLAPGALRSLPHTARVFFFLWAAATIPDAPHVLLPTKA